MARQEIQIGESTFFVQKFSVMDQIRIFGDLQKTLVPSFAKMFGIFSTSTTETSNQGQLADLDFAEGLQQLSQQLSGAELVKLVDMLVKPELVTVQRDDFNNGTDKKLQKNDFDLVFDDMPELIELVIFILRLNFESFFMKYLARLGLGQELMKKA
ncbi:phage tail assembly chaperone [Avibacterium avium]|uniref:phage tail assembly chaperone n=1 Tax=Avibacterium avium TaxID=751 RepID=UPI003BF80358